MFDEYRSTVNANCQTVCRLGEKLCEVGDAAKMVEFGIERYVKSGTFDSADLRFDTLVRPFLNHYERSDLLSLLEQANRNDQAYARRDADKDHRLLRRHLDRTGCTVEDFKVFNNVASCLLRPDEFEIADEDDELLG